MMNHPSILRMALLLLLLLHSTDAKMEIITREQDVKVGEEILMLCKTGGADGEITWYKNKEEVDTDKVEVTKVDETSSRLIIKKARMDDAGEYTCHCEFDSGHEDEIHKQLFIYDGPSFDNTPKYHEFLEGSEGKLPCLAVGLPALTVQWFRDKDQIPLNGRGMRQMQDNTLVIEKVKPDDAGTYVCKAQITGRPIEKQEYISVVINTPPSVRMKEEVKTVMAGPETNVSMFCLVSGQPKPNITWTMPGSFDPSRHHFNSDRSELTIRSVARADYGEYTCTATNKISESRANIMLHVFEAPDVSVSAEQRSVSVGGSVSVSCNVSGHPQPALHWLNKQNGQTLESASGRVQVVEGVLTIKDVIASDGGLYSCMAVSSFGNASRDVAIRTQPDQPHYLSVSPGPTSVLFSLKSPPFNGGSPITSFVLQWKQSATEQWKEVTVPSSDLLALTSLKPYTLYTVRLAALNAVGRGKFSDMNDVRTKGIRGEPDSPFLSRDEMKVEGNSFSLPIKQIDDGGTPLLKYVIRYRQEKEGAEWEQKELSPDVDSLSIKDLSFGSDYQVEVSSVNINGSSIPASFNFTTEPLVTSSRSMTKGSVVGIVMFIFLVVFLAVDATCCYRNRCGLLMFIGVKLFGQKIPGLKTIEDGDGTTNGEVKLKGLSTPRGSMQQVGVQTKEGGQLTEVTCDKAPLTKHEKIQAGRGLPNADV